MEKTAKRGALFPLLLTKYYSGTEIKRMKFAENLASVGAKRCHL
jgi:hypothetical protein